MSTTPFRRGDVALVRFVFADERGAKRRPVLILSEDEFHSSRAEAIVAAMTSNVGRLLPGDHLVRDWQKAGLPKPSVSTAILRTVKQTMIERKIGEMTATDLAAVEAALRKTLCL